MYRLKEAVRYKRKRFLTVSLTAYFACFSPVKTRHSINLCPWEILPYFLKNWIAVNHNITLKTEEFR